MQTITTIIPAKNEEKNIERCIKSVLWCDKVIVLWMGTDKTGEIAKKLGAEVIDMKKTHRDDFIEVQKNINWAIDNIKCDWMLRIDADEVVTDELRKEILKWFDKLTILSEVEGQVQDDKIGDRTSEVEEADFTSAGKTSEVNEVVAYGILRAQYFCGAFLKGGDWAYDRLVRLFRPKYCRYEPLVSVHEQFKVNGKIGYLKNKLLHYSHPTSKDAAAKFQKYTDAEINDLKETKLSAFIKIVYRPLYVFARWIIWHNGWRDGLRGIQAGAMRGWYEYLLYSKYLKRTDLTDFN